MQQFNGICLRVDTACGMYHVALVTRIVTYNLLGYNDAILRLYN
jgi:hypothetical protein